MGSSQSNSPTPTTPTTPTTPPLASKTISLTQTLRWASQQHSNKIATIDIKSNRQHTWSILASRVARFAHGLQIHAKIKPGDRVGILGLNSDVYYEAFYAVLHAGGVLVPINFRLVGEDLIHVLQDSGVTTLLIDEAMGVSAFGGMMALGLPKTLKMMCLLGKRFTSVKELVGCKSTDELVEEFDEVGDAGRGGDDAACIFYTSGTTSKSKGVVLSHINFIINSLGTLSAHGNYNSSTRFLHVAPMFHLADAQHCLCMTTLAGATNVFLERFVPQEILPVIDKYGITKLVLVSVMIQMVVTLPDVEKQAVPLRDRQIEFIYGGSPMPKPTMERLLHLLPNVRLFQGFGMTETASGLCVLKHEDHFVDGGRLMGSVGRPVPWVELRICDPDGKQVPRGEFGEILVRGGNVMTGYYGPGLAELTKETLRGGFMHTGDGGYMDKDGYVFLTDRIKDMIKTGGENVFSAEVEKVVGGMPAVQMACVVGIPDDRLGELVAVVIVPKEKGVVVTAEQVKEYCSNKLTGYKIPRRVFMREALPVSGAGKILKHVVRSELKKSSSSKL